MISATLTGAVGGDAIDDSAWFEKFAPRAWANGYALFPGNRRGKGTREKGWTAFGTTLPSEKQIERWVRVVPAHSVALACGMIVAIDIDAKDAATVERIADLARASLGANPLVRVGRAPRLALIYAAAPGHAVTTRRLGIVEILGRGAYLVGFGLHPGTGLPYRWIGPSPAELPLRVLPACTAEQVEAFAVAISTEITDPAGSLSRSPFGNAHPRQASLASNMPPPNTELASRYVRDTSGRVVDQRDAFLRDLTYGAYGAGFATAELIAEEAFARFSAAADLARPKRDGVRPWSKADALSKARALLASGKPRPPLHYGATDAGATAGFWTPSRKEAFLHAVNAAGAAGSLAPSTVAVSAAMLTYVRGDGSAFASVDTIAGRLGLTPDTVKRARRRLLAAGFWSAERVRGGRGHLAHYRPIAASLAAADASNAAGNSDRSAHPNNQGGEIHDLSGQASFLISKKENGDEI
ncbi:MAG: bifunctional DNA primase/polymerase [Methylobacterium sp.]|uniref:bifunctional DNA primase/polymerase n=1 Tax=Methylobacterium sp. TaxID=409 RepID=UPI0025FC83E1|nr:bifunctional DNA primase/polymerase [Methylobacterium sp.]MBX9933686.1 bifunctional DNA primase/polymerase [Methylobacterium sp.]